MYYKKKNIYIKQRFVIQDFIWKLIEISSGNFFFFFFSLLATTYISTSTKHILSNYLRYVLKKKKKKKTLPLIKVMPTFLLFRHNVISR